MNGRLDKVAMTIDLCNSRENYTTNVRLVKRENGNVKEQMIISTEYLMYWMSIGSE